MAGSSIHGSATRSTGQITDQVESHILRDQLEVTADELWNCVNNQVLPDRGQSQPVAVAIPVGVIRTLTQEAHIPEAEVGAMTKAEAIARITQFSTTGE